MKRADPVFKVASSYFLCYFSRIFRLHSMVISLGKERGYGETSYVF